MEQQRQVSSFIEANEMEAPPAYRLLDLVSELGEVAKDPPESTAYGDSPEDIEICSDEIGDVLFSLVALADSVDIDAADALEEALAKYDKRIIEDDSAASNN